jgi:hypothetical protein
MIESVLLGWFRHKQTLNIPIQDLKLHEKVEEIALKLNINSCLQMYGLLK